ncbi:MAG: acyl-CoA dehydrogenase family protein [Candidatus Methanomethylicia archaeon]
MRIFLGSEYELVRKQAREFAEKKLRPVVRRFDEEEVFPWDLWREAAELGYTGLMIPEEYGGSGTDPLLAVVIVEELSRGFPAFSLSLLAHFCLAGYNIAREGNEDQKKRYLPILASGKAIGAMGLTEPEAGSDATGIKTTARRDGDYYVLNGVKTFITNAPIANVFLIYAKTSPEKNAHGISVFIVERSFPGLSTSKPFEKMGNRASPTGEIYLNECRVPRENLVGEEDKGVYAMMRGLDIERIIISAIALGIMQWSIEISKEFAAQRIQFGRRIAEFQMIQEKLAEMAIFLEASRIYLYEAAKKWKITPGDRGIRGTAASVKFFVWDAAEKIAREAIQILGGYGYMRENIVEMLYRDARLGPIGAGTAEIDKLVVFRELMLRGDFTV